MDITVSGISFRYHDGPPVFSKIDMAVKSPEIFCILGPNGTGKSTLLKCLVGYCQPFEGEIAVGGRPFSGWKRKQLARIMAYIPQAHAPTFPFAVRDVVLMGRTAHLSYFSSPGGRDAEIARESLDFFGILHLCDKPYTQISGGERQLVMLAAAMTQQPEMMLLDEPTAHLDFGNQHMFLRAIKKLSRSGVGIVMTSHFPDHAFAVADTVAVMHGGTLLSQGPPRDVLTPQIMERIYNIPVKVVETPDGRHCFASLAGEAPQPAHVR